MSPTAGSMIVKHYWMRKHGSGFIFAQNSYSNQKNVILL
jgi:hypothetical protein